MTKTFYHKDGEDELLIEFDLEVEEDDGEYIFTLSEIISIFNEETSEDIEFEDDKEKWEDIINDWLDMPQNYTKLVEQVKASDYE